MSDQHILITGVTGSVGREILYQLANDDPGARISCLIRGRRGQAPQERFERLIERTFPDGMPAGANIEALEGDIEQTDLGLAKDALEKLAGSLTGIIHGAATVKFTLPLSEARRINVEGTRNMLKLAKLAKKQGERFARMDYISTAYVAGSQRGIIREDAPIGHSFNNTYEQTKAEAEQLVRAEFAKGLPGAIFRPSIILGHSRTGFTSSFKVLYWPLRIYATGLWRIAPGSERNWFDFVPVDYVAAALVKIRRKAAADGKTYHLCAGPNHAATARQICDMAAREFNRRPVIWINPKIYLPFVEPILKLVLWGKYREIIRVGQAFVPYLSSDLRFGIDNTLAELEGSDVKPPSVSDYFGNLFWYCRVSEWGKKEIPQAKLLAKLEGKELPENAGEASAETEREKEPAGV